LINDVCFLLNEQDSLQYNGKLFLQNTAVEGFKTGIYLGRNGILKARCSSFISLRGGYAINSIDPKDLSFSQGSVYKCESNGILVTLKHQLLTN
jgi:hypothetical protein